MFILLLYHVHIEHLFLCFATLLFEIILKLMQTNILKLESGGNIYTFTKGPQFIVTQVIFEDKLSKL